jgi:septal ring factor EnvC (AmiA/AmiB activator)
LNKYSTSRTTTALKQQNRRIIASLFILLCLLFSYNSVYASKKEDMSRYQGKLSELQKSIAKIQKHLTGSKKQRSEVVTELKTLETEISKNSKKLVSLETDLRKIRQQKKALEQELQQLNKDVLEHKTILSEQIRSAYSLGHQQNLKLLLNQQDPAQVGRSQEYFNYFNRTRTEQIETFLTSIEQKKDVETKLEQILETHKQLLKSFKAKTRKRQKQRQQREKLLAELGDKIKNQENTLTSLESSRGRIETLLKSLGELLADIPSNPAENTPFKSLKGKLPWPTKGKFLSRFGQPKRNGDLKWNGILIKSNYGTPIRVVSHGRVAFSDWLQGFGFITIIDHGNGYMTLYGNSETLLKKTGEWVRAGEIIATAGDSGGQPQSGVYFEIRSRGKPVNPKKWCSSSIKHAT